MGSGSDHMSKRPIQIVEVSEGPSTSGHYSKAIVANGFIFVSGQLPIHPDTGKIPVGIEAQVRQSLSNVLLILHSVESDLSSVVAATVFISDIKNWPAVNTVWAEIFGAHRPTRTVAVSPQLHFGSLVEVQVTALA